MFADALTIVSILATRAVASDVFTLPKPEGGKGLNRHSAVDWVQKLIEPPPKYSYNATNASRNNENEYWANAFVKATDYLSDLLDDLSITDTWLNSNNSTYICSTSYYNDLTNNVTCPENGSVVSIPYYFTDQLQYVLPPDACPEWDRCNGTATGICHCDHWMNTTLSAINATGKFREELGKQRAIAEQNRTLARYWTTRDYSGIGLQLGEEHRANVNLVYTDLDEVTKAGFAAVAGISALIPTLLTVTCLYVPRSLEVFATTFLVGIPSAFFSLCLPTKSTSAVQTSQVFDIAAFDTDKRHWITRMGRVNSRQVNGRKDTARVRVDISEL